MQRHVVSFGVVDLIDKAMLSYRGFRNDWLSAQFFHFTQLLVGLVNSRK